MSTHETHHATSGTPERDLLAEDIHTTFAALPLPTSGIDLSRVRGRGKRRRTLRRTLLIAPVTVIVLAASAAAWHPWSPGTVTAAQQRTDQQSPSATASPSVGSADPQTIATATVQDAILNLDGNLTAKVTVMKNIDTDSGQVLGWAATYFDLRSDPTARLDVEIVDSTRDAYLYGLTTGCLDPTQCVEEELPGQLKLITNSQGTVLVLQNGEHVLGTLTRVSAVYPDGRIVTAAAKRDVASQGDLGPGRSFDSPLITVGELQSLVTNPALAEIPWPTASTMTP